MVGVVVRSALRGFARKWMNQGPFREKIQYQINVAGPNPTKLVRLIYLINRQDPPKPYIDKTY
jgi:hypothetical protein